MLTLIAVGKLKEKYFLEACGEYEKRLRAYGGVKLLELPETRLPEKPSAGDIDRALEKEAQALRGLLPKSCWLCLLTPEGKQLSSEELAGTLARVRDQGKSELVFVIGSSFGIHPSLKRQGDLLLSMSKMTFPHHLARVMALEQLYRAESILAGSRYHK